MIVSEAGKLTIKTMRYQCRLAGKPANYDQRFPGTYNARRDSLEKFWAPAFGHTHGLMVVDTFYENVEGPDGKNQVVLFTPRTREPMLVACLWSHWVDPVGKEPDLLSFAAIRRPGTRGGRRRLRPDDHQHQARARRRLAEP